MFRGSNTLHVSLKEQGLDCHKCVTVNNIQAEEYVSMHGNEYGKKSKYCSLKLISWHKILLIYVFENSMIQKTRSSKIV